jgi:hypothetical protein
LSFWRVDDNKLREAQFDDQKNGNDSREGLAAPRPCRKSLFLLPLRDVNVDMSQRASLWAPSPMHDPVLVTFIKCLNQVEIFSTTILPMKLTNLIIAMKKVQAAFTTSAALGTDLADATARDLDLIDLFFGEGLAAVFGVVELAAGWC